MSVDVLEELLARNRTHVESLAADHFDDVQDAQFPTVASICCADSRVSQEGMWDVDEPGWLFAPSNVGNQAWDEVDGERVVNGNLMFPVEYTDTEVLVVVGHTGCGAVTAAYEVVTGRTTVEHPGIRKWVDLLVPVVRAGLTSEYVDETAEAASVIDQLVEYNVHRQVAFLRAAGEVPEAVSLYGFVYDLHGAYGDERGRTILVDVDGEADPDVVAAELPADHRDAARSILETPVNDLPGDRHLAGRN